LRSWQAKAWREEANRLTKTPECSYTTESDELWFFINGICTDHYIAQLNAECLAELFGRTIHILHNETEGFYRDLLECVNGRVGSRTVPSLLDVTMRLLLQTQNFWANPIEQWPIIVVIAHSQGTILLSAMVEALSTCTGARKLLNDYLDPAHSFRTSEGHDYAKLLLKKEDGDLEWGLNSLLKKMQVFNFANCAVEFEQKAIGDSFYPAVIEHFVNEHDLVASLAPQEQYGYAGTVFKRDGAWGHLLNIHYLDRFAEGDYKEASKSGGTSKLLSYLPKAGTSASTTEPELQQN